MLFLNEIPVSHGFIMINMNGQQNQKIRLHESVEILSFWLELEKAMFVVNEIIADQNLEKQRQYLLELPISELPIYLWCLTEPCLAMSKNLRRKAKAIFV